MRAANSLLLTIASLTVALWLSHQHVAAQALTSGLYVTAAGAMMEECGDQILTGSACDGFPGLQGRLLPFAATIALDLDGSVPVMSATMHNAVWEGGDPFELDLTAIGEMNDSGYRFLGDYLQPGYFFEWQFSTSNDGNSQVSGDAYWSGGHFWQLSFDYVPLELVPEPGAGVVGLLLIVCCVDLQRCRATAPELPERGL